MSSGLTILVVEDNPVTRKMLRVALETESYVVVEAADARSALAAARQRLPDLVLQDLILPDGDGFELARNLRALAGDELPIVALSGFAGRIEDAQSAGFSTILVKPVELTRLLDSINALLPRPAPPDSVGQSLELLIVDDDAIQLKLTRVHCAHLGFRVATAASATEALRAARKHRPDVILSDVLMPDLDGFQLCFELRRDPELASVPVVLVSAHYQTQADLELAARVGAYALLVRSANLDDIAKVLVEAKQAGVASPQREPDQAVELDHARAVIRQLERQLSLSSALERRCTLQAAQISLLGGIADALSRRTDTNTALRDVLAATLDAAAISKGALFFRGEGNALRLGHALGFTDTERLNLHGFFGRAALLEQIVQSKAPVAIPSAAVSDDATRAVQDGAGVISAQVVPLVSNGHGIGAIVLGAKNTDLTSEDATVFARAIGNQIVQSLELERSFKLLAESEQRYRTLMENAHEAIAVFTPDGVFRETNGRFGEILGLPKEQIVGRHIQEFAAPGREAENGAAFATSSGRGSGRAPPLTVRRSDGTLILLELSNTSIDLAGERVIFSVGRDVTEHLRAQAQLLVSERMASVGMLAAGVAHEINNPLAAVVANLDLAARDISALFGNAGAPPALAEIEGEIRDAREAAGHVRSLVRDLKVFSRAEEDRRTAVDVHHVLDSSVRMAWNEIRHRAQIVKDYGTVPAVWANESRLGQVFLNLVVNAAQAIPEGHANSNEIRIRTQTDAQGRAEVTVSDTGPGIPDDVLQQIFTPFFTTKPEGVGTGLGLTICHRIVSDIGGEIEVTSHPGAGTLVRVSLPASRGESSTPVPEAAVTESRRRGRILIVDDEALVGMAVRRALTPEHDVTYVASAQEALDRLGEEHFDLVLCDLMMPVMTGMELYARLSRSAPEKAERIVFLTGGAFTPRARAFLDEVSNARIEKPFDLSTLETLVNERLR